MKRLFVLLFVVYCLLASLTLGRSGLFGTTGVVFSQERYATCDLCGYCPPNQPPGNWKNCQRCLYEEVSDDPTAMETLKIDGATNLPPSPVPGRWYTMIGCINTNLGGFQQQGAAASIVQVLLNLIFSAAGGIGLVYLIYGGFLIITSQAEPEKINQGRRIVSGAIVGIIVAFASVFIVNLIAGGVLKIPGFGGGAP